MSAEAEFGIRSPPISPYSARDIAVDPQERHGSSWNFQGTIQLANVAYAYFTSLPRICTHGDLEKIAMASNGRIGLLLDNQEPPDGVVVVNVYRESTDNRTATLALWIPSEIIASSHIWLHTPSSQDAVYYETAHSAIYRIGVTPGGGLAFVGDEAVADKSTLKHFDYMLIGDATNQAGILAPYDEEHTESIFKIEKTSIPPLRFWYENRNTDQFSNKDVELQQFERKPGV